jgi:hypothetical protein
VRALALSAILLIPTSALAQESSLAPPPGPAPQTERFQYSPYEQASIEAAYKELGFSPDPNPEGKLVESVHTVRLEVIERRDWATPLTPAPRFLNAFHVVSKDWVIRREVLMKPGDVYRQTLADETQRNLSSVSQLSVVLVVAARGSTPDKVRVIVITKDVWSIRLQWNIALSNKGLEGLTINPAETNLIGTHQSLGLRYDYKPETSSLGARYVVPRVFGTRLSALADANIILNNRTGSPEGTFGTLQVQKPLWSTLTEWAYGGIFAWDYETTRRYCDAHVFGYRPGQSTCLSPEVPGVVPWTYRSETFLAGASLTRSIGWTTKNDFTLAFEARQRRFIAPDLSPYDPTVAAAFTRRFIPITDHRVGPYFQWETYTTNFLRVIDLETLALQEDYRLGLHAYARVYPVLQGLGASRDLLGFSSGVSYTLAMRDGLVRAGAESVAELYLGGPLLHGPQRSAGGITDGAVQVTMRIASPRFAIGRMVFDAFVLHRYENYLRRSAFMGGDGRLRGWPSSNFAGADALAVNVEYRSRHVELFKSVELGGVLFYDTGDAFEGWKNFNPKHGAGFGARILFPQLDRVVFRVDVGFPLANPLPAQLSPASFFVTFEQAFPLHAIEPKTAVSL